ncbi:stalk domain-containing protein [Cohnella terricola]|uniref:Copper amine oxidase-like N-terminal domain-containing protein n=1 Tax=Cohnella terricola TaxID=1289167 RepID=A0A559JTM2_9BACL|nr:stalk domain-containing protein [Cohnella terricola]TVY03221.1 hypothetical protein FPZ45_04920 [Cohnella terricola]
MNRVWGKRTKTAVALGMVLAMLMGCFGLKRVSAAGDDGKWIVDVAIGSFHSVALARNGTVWAWGSNGIGQLGLGQSVMDAKSPVKVPGIDRVIAIDAGNYHTVALREDGTVWVWGNNVEGELGNGTYTSLSEPGRGGARQTEDNRNAYVPQIVPGLTDQIGVKATGTGVVAWDKDGSLWSWGDSTIAIAYPGMDTEREMNKLKPRRNEEIKQVAAVEGTSSSLAVLAKDGTVWTQGSSAFGQSGSGERSNIVSTVHVPNLENVVRLDSTGRTTIAYLKDGKTLEWGQALLQSKGFNPTDPAAIDKLPVNLKPTATGELQGISMIASTMYKYVEPSYAALKPDGTVWTHGDNATGQLGTTSLKERYSWGKVEGLPSIAKIKGYGGIAAAVGKDGSLWMWGRNNTAQLGDGTTANRFVPTAIGGFGSAKTDPLKPASGYGLKINGKSADLPAAAAPKPQGSSFVMPLTQAAKAFGAKLSWDKNRQTAEIVRGKSKVVLKLNGAEGTVNSKSVKLPIPAKQQGSDWLIPADWLAKQFGGTVKVDTSKRILAVDFKP